MILKGGSPNLLDALGKIPRASRESVFKAAKDHVRTLAAWTLNFPRLLLDMDVNTSFFVLCSYILVTYKTQRMVNETGGHGVLPFYKCFKRKILSCPPFS